MKASEMFAHARDAGSNLHGNESRVIGVPSLHRPRRAWLGEDSGLRPVAYFEVAPGRGATFAVSQVISVETLAVHPPGEEATVEVIRLTCHEIDLTEVFFVFMDEILHRIAGGTDTVTVVTSAASEWRSLLQVAVEGISETAAAGLYGELRFLEESLAALGPTALSNWQRRERDVHDFVTDNTRVEVKTSAFQNRAAVTVHGLKQLEPPVDATLTLAVAEVQRHGGETLDDVTERIFGTFVDRTALLEKLSSAGYVPGMPGASDLSFTLLSWRFWEITTEAPVLNRSVLPQAIADAVSSVSYTLDIGVLGRAEESFDHHRLSHTGRTDS